MMFDLPPQVQGTPDVIALRDYLVRLAQSLEQVTGEAVTVATNAVTKSQKDPVKDIQAQAASLKALIIKNANEIYQYTDTKVEEYGSQYVAKSDFGNYYEQIESQVETTARGEIENYEYREGVTIFDELDSLSGYMTELNGQIRRGVIVDPDTNLPTLGIVISQQVSFGSPYVDDDTYTWITPTPQQSFGFYTSTGWQFWIGDQKMGWFSSSDSMLHVANIVVENKLQLGDNWQITTDGGFGLRYVGG